MKFGSVGKVAMGLAVLALSIGVLRTAGDAFPALKLVPILGRGVQ